jgi:hypothetical protein
LMPILFDAKTAASSSRIARFRNSQHTRLMLVAVSASSRIAPQRDSSRQLAAYSADAPLVALPAELMAHGSNMTQIQVCLGICPHRFRSKANFLWATRSLFGRGSARSTDERTAHMYLKPLAIACPRFLNGGGRRIRTSEPDGSGFTVRRVWPLRYPSICS